MTPNLIPALIGVALVYGAGVVTAHSAELLAPPQGARVYCATVGTSESVFIVSAKAGDSSQPPIVWRCVKGAVYVCGVGADGIACSARTRSRIPFPSMIAACRDYGQLSVADGAMTYVWRWECRDGKPVIVGPQVSYDFRTNTRTTAKFDAQGYEESEWKPLREARP